MCPFLFSGLMPNFLKRSCLFFRMVFGFCLDSFWLSAHQNVILIAFVVLLFLGSQTQKSLPLLRQPCPVHIAQEARLTCRSVQPTPTVGSSLDAGEQFPVDEYFLQTSSFTLFLPRRTCYALAALKTTVVFREEGEGATLSWQTSYRLDFFSLMCLWSFAWFWIFSLIFWAFVFNQSSTIKTRRMGPKQNPVVKEVCIRCSRQPLLASLFLNTTRSWRHFWCQMGL